jgi:outer membrane protein OmpA-like peptidoglycan-associated protein
MSKNPLKIIAILLFLFSLNLFVFAQNDAPRQTIAITYPLDELVLVQFRGTTRFPRMRGDARIKRTSKNGTQIELSVSKMPRPFELGAGYATYVLWAISPDGQVDNLGEIKRRGTFEFDSTIKVTTPLQQFALIVTAEPHYLVKQPSRAVMLENLNPISTTGQFIPAKASVQYFGNSSDYFRDSHTPEIAEYDYTSTPSTILQARQAVALAKYAGATRDATEELKQAEDLLKQAEENWKAKVEDDQVDITARQSIGAAVKAEDTAVIRKQAREQRNERQRQDAEIRRYEEQIDDYKQQIESLKAELNRETRNRELAERDTQNYDKVTKDLRDENGKLREENVRLKIQLDDLNAKATKAEEEKQAAEKQRLKDEKNNRIQSTIPILMQSLKSFGAVRQNDQGLVLVLPETFWTGTRVSSFSSNALPKLDNIAAILQNNPDFKVIIESHTDDKGTPTELQTLTQERSQAIADRFISFGISEGRFEIRGLGASMPIAPNTTNINRAKNRRTEITLTPIYEQ